MGVPQWAPADLSWINEQFARLWEALREAQNRQTLEAASVGEGGITVNGGTIEVRDDNSNLLAVIGKVPLGAGLTGDGVVFFRGNNGAVAMSSYVTPGGINFPAFWDSLGNIVVSTDEVSGKGLARPYVPWTHTTDADTRTTTSASFAALHSFAGYRQHPRMTLGLAAFASDGTTAGEVRVVNGGTVLAGPTTIPAGGSIAPEYTFSLPGNYMDLLYVDVQARRTAGAGTISVRPYYQHGTQS